MNCRQNFDIHTFMDWKALAITTNITMDWRDLAITTNITMD
jgi:hypothetical protein